MPGGEGGDEGFEGGDGKAVCARGVTERNDQSPPDQLVGRKAKDAEYNTHP